MGARGASRHISNVLARPWEATIIWSWLVGQLGASLNADIPAEIGALQVIFAPRDGSRTQDLGLGHIDEDHREQVRTT